MSTPMSSTEVNAKLAEDSMALEAALGNLFDANARQRMADVLMGERKRDRGDCALDIIIEDRPVSERVAIQSRAKEAGYQRPWPRHGVGAI